MLASLDTAPAEWIGELVKQGPGWAVAGILACCVWYLWRDSRTSAKACEAERAIINKVHEAERAAWWLARLADWKEITTLVREQNVVQSQLTAARETGSAATNAMTEALKLQGAVVSRMVDAVDRWIASTESLRETILTKVVKS